MLCSHHKRIDEEEVVGYTEAPIFHDRGTLASETGRVHWYRPWCEICQMEKRTEQRLENGLAEMRKVAREGADASLSRLLNSLGLPPLEPTAQQQEALRARLGRLLPFIGMLLLVTTLTQPEQVGRDFLERLYFKSGEVGPLQSALFWLALAVGWYIKPVLALLLERYAAQDNGKSLYAMRRWIVGSTALGGCVWLVLWAVVARFGNPGLVACFSASISVILALVSALMGRMLVELAQQMGATGRLGAMHAAAIFLARLLSGGLVNLVGGASIYGISGVSATVLLISALVAASVLTKEERISASTEEQIEKRIEEKVEDQKNNRINARSEEKIEGHATVLANRGMVSRAQQLLGSRNVLGASAIAVLLYLAPNFVALQHNMNDRLGFSSSTQNYLDVVGASFGLLGVACYLWLCRRVSLQTMLRLGIVCNGLGTLCYLGYNSLQSAYVIEAANGLLSALIFAMLFDLAIRAIPRGLAMPGYALLTGVIVLSSHLSNLFGSWLSVGAGWGFTSVVVLSAALSLPALGVVALLPASLLDRREGHIVADLFPVSERASGTGIPSLGASR